MPIFRRFLAGAAAAAAVAALTACDADQVGTAVSAGGDRLSVSDLQDQVLDVVDMRNSAVETFELGLPPLDPGGDLADVQATEVQRWIATHLFEEVADVQEITVSEADVDAFLDELAVQFPDGDLTPFFAEQGFTEESIRGAARIELVNQQLQATDPAAVEVAFADALDRLDVDVNPRYGEWNGQELIPDSGSVSVPVDGAPAEMPPLG